MQYSLGFDQVSRFGCDVLISIKPQHADPLYAGTKKYELRKVIPRKIPRRVFLYETDGSAAITVTLPRFPGHLVKIHCRSRISGCGSCWQRGALSKRRWKSGVDFHGRVSFHS